jgi:hypothetical protein
MADINIAFSNFCSRKLGIFKQTEQVHKRSRKAWALSFSVCGYPSTSAANW